MTPKQFLKKHNFEIETLYAGIDGRVLKYDKKIDVGSFVIVTDDYEYMGVGCNVYVNDNFLPEELVFYNPYGKNRYHFYKLKT